MKDFCLLMQPNSESWQGSVVRLQSFPILGSYTCQYLLRVTRRAVTRSQCGKRHSAGVIEQSTVPTMNG